MKLYLSTLFLLLFASAHAQTNYRVIGAAQQIKTLINGDFYIQKIEDQRSFQANLGIVNRGTDKVLKRPLIEEEGFFDIMLKRMNHWIKPAEEAIPVTLQIRQLYLWEHLNERDGQGFVRLEAGFLKEGTEAPLVVEVELSGEQIKVVNGHAPRLEKAFFECLNQYQQQDNLLTTSQANRPALNPEDTPYLIGVTNFLDLKQENYEPMPAAAKLRRMDRRELYRYRLKNKKETPYYAILKEGTLYLKANNYPGDGDYFVRVLEKGQRYLFMIDEIYVNEKAHNQLNLPYSRMTVGIIIDMETGVPQIVTDELMEELLGQYPALEGHYIFKDILEQPFQLRRVQKAIADINQIEEQGKPEN